MTTATDALDPTIATLVPRTSRRRDLTVGVVAALALVSLWFSPPLFRPSLGSELTGGADMIDGTGEVVSFMRVDPQGFPDATVVSVGDVPGAQVDGAWLVSEEEWGDGGTAVVEGRPDGLAHVRAMLADVDPAARALPRAALDEDQYLVVLWQVTDCSALSAAQGPQVTVRTSWGVRRTAGADPMPGLDTEFLDPASCRSLTGQE